VLERKAPGAGSSTRSGGGFRSQLGTATNIRLSVLSEPYWSEFEERFGVDPWLQRIGYLFLAADDAELQTLRHQVDLQHEFGVPSELMVADDLSTRWPILGDLGFTGGSLLRSGWLPGSASRAARSSDGGGIRGRHYRVRFRSDRIRCRS
jgi:glycine/D-amino acid oxidase-like deaminating enzyme